MYKKFRIFKADHRLFFHFGQKCMTIESYFFSRKCNSLCLEFEWAHDFERTIGFTFGIPFIARLGLSFDLGYYNWLKKICTENIRRTYGFDVNSRDINIFFHADPFVWPSGFSRFIPWERILKGRRTISIHAFKMIVDKEMTLPEGYGFKEKTYNITMTRRYLTFKYSRWFSKVVRQWIVNCPEGVPHPGKGTTAYNCGNTKIYSLSFSDQTKIEVDETAALQKFYDECMRLRREYPL